MQCPNPCQVPQERRAPDGEQAQGQSQCPGADKEAPLPPSQVAWPCPLQGFRPSLCFHLNTGGYGGRVELHPFSETSLKTTAELALQAGEQEWQQAKLAFTSWEFHSPSCCQLKGRAALEDSVGPCLPTGGRRGFEAGQDPPGKWKQEMWRMEGLPLLLFCSELGTIKGQSAQESESQQVAATPTPMPKEQTKQGNEKMGRWGWEDKPKQNPLTSCPGRRVQPVAWGWGPGLGVSSWAGIAPDPRSCPRHQRPRRPRCSGP